MIYLTVTTILTFLGLVNGETRFVDPFQVGPYDVIHHKFSSDDFEGLEENLHVYTPTTNGNFPILYYLDGMAMAIPGSAFSEVSKHLASHGMVVVTPSMSNMMITPSQKVPYFISVMEWSEIYLEGLLHNSSVPLDVTLDFGTLLALAHSAGSHVLVQLLKDGGCRNFQAMVLMSPVDGVDPAGIIPDYCIKPGEKLNFVIPTLHMAAGYDPEPGISGYACAPDRISNERFWNALSADSDRWSINATEFAHFDFLDEEIRQLAADSKFCGLNEALPIDSLPSYRQFIGGSIIAFFRALTEENCEDYLQYLENPELMLVSTTERHVRPSVTCPKLSCSWTPLY